MTQSRIKQLQSALTLAYHDYEKGLQSHAFFKLQDRTVGGDLVQDAFMKTWMYLVKGGKIERMRAFLYHVLNDLIVDQYRKRKTVSLDLILENGFEQSTGNSERLFNILDGRSATQLIKKLPISYRGVMRMRYIQDLSLKEMSAVTGQSKNSIAVQAHRGLEKLKLLYNT